MTYKCISNKEEVDLYNFMKDFQDPDPECCFKSFDKITGNALSNTNENVCSKCNAVMDENTFANGQDDFFIENKKERYQQQCQCTLGLLEYIGMRRINAIQTNVESAATICLL